MNKFAYRLKKLREEKKLSKEKLSKEIRVSYKAIQRWEKEQQIPRITKVIILAKYFKVSTDYLLGLED